jgi:sugar phosphate isomerase/epimerase
MKLGFVSAIVPELSLEQVLDLASRQRYECVELMCWPVGKAERRYAGVTHIDATKFTRSDAGRVLELCAAKGVAISALGYYPNALSADAAEARAAVAQIKRVIAASALLGVNQMNTFIGRDPKKSVEENWPAFLKTWRPIVQYAADQGVRIGIENCPMFFSRDEWPGGKNLATTPAIWQRMFEAIPEANLGLNYDPSHLVWQQMDYLAPLRQFASRIFHVHAKDVRMDREKLNQVGIMATPLEYHCPKLPGLGEVNWGRFFSILGDTGYQGAVCVEVEDRAYEQTLASRELALKQSYGFLRQFMAGDTAKAK